ncbi:MAG: ATP synthase subunit I [Deltaproteobacteria bacterium]|nr:ATP synthase subunit I [Deltaproteobacteria bacterium]
MPRQTGTTGRRETEPPFPGEETVRRAIAFVAASGALLALGAVALYGTRAALGVAIGGVLAAANLWLLARMARAVVLGTRHRRLWLLAGFAKLAALLAVIWLLMRSGVVGGLALAIGYGALPLGITVSGLLRPSWRT